MTCNPADIAHVIAAQVEFEWKSWKQFIILQFQAISSSAFQALSSWVE
jgi:hypothetical protein